MRADHLLDGLVPRADHHCDAVDPSIPQRLQDMRDHRQPADLVQHLGPARAHALAFAGGEHHGQG
jgi:hypothetical protein